MNFTIDFEPTAKGMPRTKFVNGQVITYMPTKTKEAMEAIKVLITCQAKGKFKSHTPIKLTATFYRTKSKWLPKREVFPFRKPDLDNFTKLLLDSINKSIVPDDAQITTISVSKRWSGNNHGYIVLNLEEDRL